MEKMIIKFSSVTYALKAKEIIERSGGKAVMKKNPKPSKKEGCGYSLTVVGNTGKFITLLDLNKIRFIGYEMIG